MEDYAIQTQPQSKHEPTACPVCGALEALPILELRNIPLLANVLWDNQADALSAPRSDVSLVFCLACGHAFNQAFDPAQMAYQPNYENSLHFSAHFQSYAEWLANYLVEKYNLRGKSIIEIGSGKGDFLKLLCEYGANTGTGFDPSYDPRGAQVHPAMTCIRDYYDHRYAQYQADLICARHTLEHIYQPAVFLQSLRQTIRPGARPVVFMEVPNFEYILRDTAIWDVIYEHYSYFSASSLARLFEHNSFEVLNISDAFHGQFLYIEAIPTDGEGSNITLEPERIAALAAQAGAFGQRSQMMLDSWRARLEALRAAGKRAAIWGAGSKGISFLNLMPTENVACVVDINSRKIGKYVTGAGQEIVTPERLPEFRPDVVIIMNPAYRDEIQRMITGLRLRVELLTAI